MSDEDDGGSFKSGAAPDRTTRFWASSDIRHVDLGTVRLSTLVLVMTSTFCPPRLRFCPCSSLSLPLLWTTPGVQLIRRVRRPPLDSTRAAPSRSIPAFRETRRVLCSTLSTPTLSYSPAFILFTFSYKSPLRPPFPASHSSHPRVLPSQLNILPCPPFHCTCFALLHSITP